MSIVTEHSDPLGVEHSNPLGVEHSDPLGVDVFVREEFHRSSQDVSSGTIRFDDERSDASRERASISRISSGLLNA